MKLWIGEEREGIYKGKKTLFIGSNQITIKDITVIIINSDERIGQLYFGAGLCSDINTDVVKECVRVFKSHIITLEIDINKLHEYDIEVLKEVNLIITHTHKNYNILNQLELNNDIQLKIQSLEKDNRIIALSTMTHFKLVDVKSLKEKTYIGDIVIK